MREFIATYIKSCDCFRFKSTRHKPLGLLQPLPIPQVPFSDISVDFIVGLPPSLGYNSICVFVCRLIKRAIFVRCQDTITSEELAQIYLDNVFRPYGLATSIVSDRGPQFISRFWRAFCDSLGISVLLSTSHHPETDGQTERTNQVLEQFLRIYSNYHQNNWAEMLPLAEFSFNNSVNASTKFTPFFSHFGFHPRSDAFSRSIDSPVDLLDSISDTMTELKANLVKAQERYKIQADRHRIDHEFQVGDLVWLSTRYLSSRRPSRKLDYRRIGPYPILERIGRVAYKLQLPHDLKIHPVFHISLLEPATANPFPNRIAPPPAPIDIEADLEYEVEEVLDSRRRGRGIQYLILWKGYPISDSTWEPPDNVRNAQDLVADFHRRYPNKPAPRGGVL